MDFTGGHSQFVLGNCVLEKKLHMLVFPPPARVDAFLLLLKHVDRCNDSPAAFVETAGSNRETINETRKKTGARMMRLKGSYCI